MQETQFFFDNFSSYLTSPAVIDSSIGLSKSTIMEILTEYANFIQWAHMKNNCYSSIKLYCNQLKSALVWSSCHGGKLSPHTAPSPFRGTSAAASPTSIYPPSPSARSTNGRWRRSGTLLKGNLNNFNMYLHRLLRMIGEEFNDIVITEVKTNGKMKHIVHQKWELCIP